MSSPAQSPGSGSGERLRADAPEWAPQVPRRDTGVRPIRTSSRQRGDVLASLDAIPFTPSQGVCTPSPTNMAAMWVPHPFFQTQQAWTPMANFASSPGPGSSGGSDSSMLLHTASQPGTPGGAGAGMFGGPSMVWGGFCQPMPYSPTALQIAAASGALGSDPSTPVRGRPGSATAAAAAAASMGGPFVMPGSPVMLSPGQMMFSQYFGADGAARGSKQRSQSPPESKDSGSGDEGDASDGGMSSNGSGNLEVSEAAHQIASAMCAAQQLPGEPPQQLLELASLLHAYGLVSAVPAFPPAGPQPPTAPSGAPLSPDSRRQQHRQRQKSVPKLNADGSVRLNARQRRTLRRAQERAMKALLEAQTKAHGITSEQAANNLASMGVASMLLGSPPPPVPAPIHSAMPMHMPAVPAYLAAPMPMSPGPMPAMLAGPPMHHDFGLMHGMQQAAAAAAMMQQQAAVSAGYEAGYGLTGSDSLPIPIPLHGGLAGHSTPPPRYAGSRAGPTGYGGGGYRGTPGSGGYRGTPGGGRMSRFAPPDAVAAF